MNKSITMRIVASLLLFFLTANIAPVALAADEDTFCIVGYSTYADEQTFDGEESKQIDQVRMTVWGTLAQAKNYYGHDWDYVVVGFNAALGYFLCYYEMTDGTRNYFGCHAV